MTTRDAVDRNLPRRLLALSGTAVVAVVATAFLARFAADVLIHVLGGQEDLSALTVAGMTLALPMIVAVAVAARRSGATRADLHLSAADWRWRWLLPLVGLVLVLFVIRAAIAVPLLSLERSSSAATPLPPAPALVSWGALAVTVLVVGIFGPAGEELVFRSVLFRWLLERRHRWVAILLSSALFSVLHVGALAGSVAGGASQLIGTFISGVAYALVYERIRSTWAVMVLHALNNTLAEVSSALILV